MVLAFIMIQVFTIDFPKTFTNLCISRGFKICFIPQLIIKIGLWKFDSILNFLITAIYCMLCFKLLELYCDQLYKYTSGLLESIKQVHETNQELNTILENLEESIIIMTNERVEFLNLRFIFYFGKYLHNYISHFSPSKPISKEIPSRLTKVKTYLKSKFLRR